MRIVGSISDIERLARLFRVRTVYLVSGTVFGKQLRDLLDQSSDKHWTVRIIPALDHQLMGAKQLAIRDVEFDDLLRRQPARLDENAIGQLITGKCIMITGAGGSIGSELSRQILRFRPSRLILLGRGENRIFRIERELKAVSGVELIPVITNCTDAPRMDEAFRRFRPQVVFHAAAHKHVPLTEDNEGEAVINNVVGTQAVADLADQYQCEMFVLVSTDKAVNPTSVMGCTKQLAERYCLALGTQSRTRFVATRFGNVLGSDGSVVPLFREQIRHGGPITITDPRMTRYFMTISEASQLVLQAATMGRGGEIFVLDMGEPVKILDMARDLVRLAGLPPEAIEIEFTGIRKGEKLFEELNYLDEKSIKTDHEKVLISQHRPFVYQEVKESLLELVDLAYGDPTEIRRRLKQLVPEYTWEPTADDIIGANVFGEA